MKMNAETEKLIVQTLVVCVTVTAYSFVLGVVLGLVYAVLTIH